MLTLCYSAFSPYCRKVRMALDHKGLDYTLTDGNNVINITGWNPRAEVPLLIDGQITVRNSATILDYLDRAYPQSPVFPAAPAAYASAKEWELIADTMLDPIVTNLSLWKWANMSPMPAGMQAAAERQIAGIYDRLNAALEGQDYLVGTIGAADFALYPQVAGANFVGLPFDKQAHANIAAWLKRVRASGPGQIDMAAILDFWQNLDKAEVDRDRINWGTYRLEWLLAHGYVDWFRDEVRQNKVLWSVGPQNNALNNPAGKKNA